MRTFDQGAALHELATLQLVIVHVHPEHARKLTSPEVGDQLRLRIYYSSMRLVLGAFVLDEEPHDTEALSLFGSFVP